MIKALKGHVVVENLDDNIKSDTIIIPGTHKEKNMIGRVTDSAIKDIMVGDVILFGRYGGKEIPYRDSTYRSINGEDIMAITDPELDKIFPVSDWMLVEMDKAPEKIGSLFVPTKKKEDDAYNHARVITCGPGRVFKNGETCKMTVKAGDKILFGPYCSCGVKRRGQDLTMVRETSCEAIMGGE